VWVVVGSTSKLWGFKSVGGLAPNTYTHALFADFDLAGQKRAARRLGESGPDGEPGDGLRSQAITSPRSPVSGAMPIVIRKTPPAWWTCRT
jgi:hypothetical protein